MAAVAAAASVSLAAAAVAPYLPIGVRIVACCRLGRHANYEAVKRAGIFRVEFGRFFFTRRIRSVQLIPVSSAFRNFYSLARLVITIFSLLLMLLSSLVLLALLLLSLLRWSSCVFLLSTWEHAVKERDGESPRN